MAKFKELEISSWNEFEEVVFSYGIHIDNSSYWFCRGQTNKEWGLLPSISRIFETENEKKHIYDLEVRAVHDFKENSAYYTNDYARKSYSYMEWWPLMQHYSCPTRLIDWSLSPYIALYFAVSGQSEIDGALWLCNSQVLEEMAINKSGNYKDEKFSFATAPKAVYPLRSIVNFERLAAQQGVFTFATNPIDDQAEVISEVFDRFATNYFIKINIPSHLKYKFLLGLRAMDVTARTIFPGIDGVGKSTLELLKVRLHLMHHKGDF